MLIGQPITLRVEVYNGRPVVDAFQVAVLRGIDDQPFVTDRPDIELFPDTSGELTLTFTLPRGFLAGRQVIGVMVTSVTDETISAVEEVVLNVAPVNVATFTVQPQNVTAGRQALFEVSLQNLGNVPVEATLRPADMTGGLSFRVEHPILVADPGGRGSARVLAHGRRPFVGSPTPHILSFTAEGLPEPLQTTATFVQKPLLPRGLLALLSILLVVLIWAAVVLLGVNRAVDRATETKAVAVVGSVTGHVGAPAGSGPARVTLLSLSANQTAQAASGVPPQVVTDDAGDYRLENLPTPATYQIVFAKDGFGTQSRVIDMELGQHLTAIDVELVDGDGHMSGLVTDGKGPLGGVEVTATGDGRTVHAVTSSTGPAGTYTLERLPTPATYTIEFGKRDYTSQTRFIEVAPAGRRTGLDVVLTKGRGSISGTAVDQDGMPVSDLTVTVMTGSDAVPGSPESAMPTPTMAMPPKPSSPPLVRTSSIDPADVVASTKTLAEGAIGFYSLAGLPAPATLFVIFEKPGFVTKTERVVLAEDGAETSLSPVLQPLTGSLVGIVTENIRDVPPCAPGQCRLAEVEVKVTNNKGAQVGATVSASSPRDRLGQYEITGLPAGAYNVTFSKDGYAPRTISLTLEDEENRSLDVTLDGEPGSLAGTAANCDVVTIAVPGSGRVAANVRPDGSFKLDRRLPTPARVQVTFAGKGGAGSPAEAQLGPGETKTDVTGSCPPPPPPPPPAPPPTAPTGLGGLFRSWQPQATLGP